MLTSNMNKLVDVYKGLVLGVTGFKLAIPSEIAFSHVWRIEKFNKFFEQGGQFHKKKLRSCDFGPKHNEEQSYHLKLQMDEDIMFPARIEICITLEQAFVKKQQVNTFYQISLLDDQGNKYKTQGNYFKI